MGLQSSPKQAKDTTSFQPRLSNFSIIPFYPNEYPMIENCISKEGFLRILPNNLNFGSDDIINGSDGFFVSLLKMDT